MITTDASPATNLTYVAALSRASKNRVEVLGSENCACFSCFRRFTPAQVTRWIDAKQTALCPMCGIDTVLGSAGGGFDETFLRRMSIYLNSRAHK